MKNNAIEENYEYVELFENPALFTNSRIDKSTVPEGLYCYDLRGSDYDPGLPVTVENSVAVNHAGSVITADPLSIPDTGYISLEEGLNFIGGYMTLKEFCNEYGFVFEPQDSPSMDDMSY